MNTNLWIEKYRPRTLEDIVLSKEDREFFESLASKQEIPHLLFAGTPGVGKTSQAHIITKDVLECDYLYINSSDENSVDTARHKITNFAKTKSFNGNLKVVILDECDGMTADAQKILRSVTEEFAENTRFILTCNYIHKVIPALQSRCQIITLNPPLEGVVQRIVSILKKEKIVIPEDQKHLLLKHIKENLPDVRRIINDIQQFSVTGTLNIKATSSFDFAFNIFKKIEAKEDMMKIRKELIENEKVFANDYHRLLKDVFEAVFTSDIENERKRDLLLIISHGMETHSVVIDKEINCFAALLNLSRNISS